MAKCPVCCKTNCPVAKGWPALSRPVHARFCSVCRRWWRPQGATIIQDDAGLVGSRQVPARDECPICTVKAAGNSAHKSPSARTDAEWRQIIAEFEEIRKHGGKTGAYLASQGIISSTFYKYRKTLAKADG